MAVPSRTQLTETTPLSSPRDQAVAYVRYIEALARTQGGESPEVEATERDHDAAAAILRDGPAHRAWSLIVEILRQAPEDRLNAYAAGPLEDVVRSWGPALVEDIEREAERDERFRWALGCIWLEAGALPPDILTRVVQASGGVIKPLRPGGNQSA